MSFRNDCERMLHTTATCSASTGKTLYRVQHGIFWSEDDLYQMHTEIEALLPAARVETDRLKQQLQAALTLAEKRGFEIEALRAKLAEGKPCE